MARRAVTPYLDEVVYKRLQELIKPKRVSREIDDLIRRRIAELEGGEYNPAETEDYEALKREHNRLVREAEKLRRHSDYELAKRLHEFKEKLGYSTTQLGNLLKKSQSWVVKHLNILKLERVMTRVITQSHFLRDVRSDKFVVIGLGHILYGKKQYYYEKRSYTQFKSDIDNLINAYHHNFGSKLSYKDLDVYLWLYGQKINRFKGVSKEVKDLNKKYSALFKQL